MGLKPEQLQADTGFEMYMHIQDIAYFLKWQSVITMFAKDYPFRPKENLISGYQNRE